MKRMSALIALTLAASTSWSAPALAAPPGPRDPGDAIEASTRVYDESYDDRGAALTVLDRRWVVLRFVGEDEPVYFGTRGGSKFLINYCNKDGRDSHLVEVSRKRFLERVVTGAEKYVTIDYDADRDSGIFKVTTYYRTPLGEPTCDPDGSNQEPPGGRARS